MAFLYNRSQNLYNIFITMWKSVLAIIGVSIFIGLFWYNFVSGWYLVFNPEVRFVTSAGDTVYLEEDTDATTVLVYNSNFNISQATINSLCDIDSRFLDSYKDLYFFEVDYKNDLDCDNWNVVLQLWEEIYGNTIYKLDVTKWSIVFEKYLDYSDAQLQDVQDQMQYELDSNSIFKNYNNIDIAKNFKYYKGKNLYNNAQLHKNLITLILEGRNQKYLTPVEGRYFSDAHTKLPNSPRPYRNSYTDWIHRWFDIDGEIGDTAISLDTWIVVRVVDGFDNDSDFSRIVYWDDLSDNQKLKNLDILRWNQVWIKTLRGDVVFYSHLDSIDSNIQEGDLVKRWQIVGKTWVSGVPEKWYSDYHLHFAVMMNPYDILRAWNYDFWDYMSWDWLWQGMTHSQVIQLRKDTFE